MVITTPKTVFTALVLNKYRAAGKFYDKKRGHTGVDLDYNYEPFLSPITGLVVKVANQKEMGKTCYIRDVWGNIHVFAHFSRFTVTEGEKVVRSQILGLTGNTGTSTTYRHVHYEILGKELRNPKEDYGRKRTLWHFIGYNTDPIKYLKDLYEFHGINIITSKFMGIPKWLDVIKRKLSSIPKWLDT